MLIRIFSDVCLLLALVIVTGCTSYVHGYVKEKKMETIVIQACAASLLSTLLLIVMAFKVIVQLVELSKCTQPLFWLC